MITACDPFSEGRLCTSSTQQVHAALTHIPKAPLCHTHAQRPLSPSIPFCGSPPFYVLWQADQEVRTEQRTAAHVVDTLLPTVETHLLHIICCVIMFYHCRALLCFAVRTFSTSCTVAFGSGELLSAIGHDTHVLDEASVPCMLSP